MDEYTDAIARDAELVREAIAEGISPGKDHLKRLADLLADAKIRYDTAQAEADEEKKAYDVIEATLFDALEAAGLESIRTERGLFRLNDLAWARIEDAEAAKAWADAHMPELLTLNSQRLSKVVRDALKGDVEIDGAVAGTGLMPGIGYVTSRKITWRRQ